jgi:hypothetical protein
LDTPYNLCILATKQINISLTEVVLLLHLKRKCAALDRGGSHQDPRCYPGTNELLSPVAGVAENVTESCRRQG